MDIRFFSGPEAFSDISDFHRQPGSPWRTSANTSNNTCHISIIFRHALPRLSCALARAVIIIPAACTLLARYYGVILYSKIKATSFRVRARDYDSCNKPISIGRHNSRALPENFNAICTEKRRPPLLHPPLFIHVRERMEPFDEFANGAGRNDHCTRFSLYPWPIRHPVCLPDPPESSDSVATARGLARLKQLNLS